jgi:HYR domain-containing protein
MDCNRFARWRRRSDLRGKYRVAAPSVPLLTLVAHLLLTLGMASPARAVGGSVTDLNGSDPRPFYVVAHNPNTLHDVEVALQAGANALEPDITVAEPDTDNPSCGTGVLVDWDSSAPNRDGLCSDTRFVDWLVGVHNLAIQYPNLALIVFDIKSRAADPDHGAEILRAIRTYLNTDPVNLNVILSVATKDDLGVFDKIDLPSLREREGVQVDSENDAGAVVNYFTVDRNYAGHIAYGDGTIVQGPNLPRAIDRAAFLRASTGLPRAVTYVYTLNHVTSMHSFIESGVDGIIPDAFGSQATGDPAYITELLGVVGEHPEIRLATRDDNPFVPALQSYGLEVRTSSDSGSGTDANINFLLVGCRGSASVTVDTGDVLPIIYDSGRMESGNTDWVTIPSKNLGKLTQVVVFNMGGGDFPQWKFDDLRVSSARWLLGPNVNHAREYTVALDGFPDNTVVLDENAAVVLDLTPNFPEPLPTIQCPAPITVPNAPGQCGAAVTFSPTVSGMCLDVSAVSTPPSGSTFVVGSTTVSSYAKSASGPQSDPCTFTVTVQDTENPAITCPAPMVVAATSPQGVAVSFTPSATDNCSVATLTSSPPSGSVFPIGTTTVNDEATDPSGNRSSCSFTIHVKGAAEQTADLITAVKNLATKTGIRNALLVKLNAALKNIQRNNTGAACGELQAFINLADAQRGKAITVGDADSLIAASTQIRAVIGC